MKSFLKLALTAIVITLFVTGCKKYEDGPSVSLRTKKARLTGDWKMDKFLYNDQDLTSIFTMGNGNFTIDIEKDNSYRMVSGNDTDKGKWELGEDKDDIFFKSETAGATDDVWRITRLKNKELWMKQTQSNGDVIKMQLKQ